jgi:hypothetical protein
MAIASLVLGILSLTGMTCVTGIPGAILGHMALRQIRDSRGTETGEGLAMGGLICSYISLGLALLVVLGWVIFFVLMGGLAALSAAAS